MGEKRVFKKTKKLSGVRGSYRKWNEWAEGDYIIGTYLSQSTDNYDKPNYALKIEDAEWANKKKAKEILGKVLVLNSNGMLDKAMEKIEEGQMVQITYVGTSTIEKGKYKGKDSHVVEVDLVEEAGDEDAETEVEDVDDEDSVDNEEETSDDSEDGSDWGDQDETEEEQNEEVEDEEEHEEDEVEESDEVEEDEEDEKPKKGKKVEPKKSAKSSKSKSKKR